jgi:hypothetical protein
MAEEGFDFEALDDESELSSLVTATPSSSIAGEDGAGNTPLEIEEEGTLHASTVKGLSSSLSSLRPKFITVLSDFGETEKFVIEGDSLLLHAFSDPALNWTHGGQFLHLTFIVETFLHELIERGAHFCVVFFESHKAIWHNDGAKCVARSLLIRHLQACLPATKTTSAKTFESPACDEWVDFFGTYLPCLVVISDELPAAPNAQISPVRGFMLDAVIAGVNIMLLRDIEILDHQLRGYYLSGKGAGRSKIGISNALYTTTTDVDGAAVESFVRGGAGAALCNDWAVVAVSWACSEMLQKPEGMTEDKIAATKLVLLDVLLLRFAGIPLAHRAHMLCASGDSLSERLSPFQETALGVLREMLTSLAHSAWCTHDGGVFGTSLDPRTACDFIDGRLLLSLAAAAEACEECTAETLGLNSDIQKMAAEACPSPRMFVCVCVCVCVRERERERERE